MSADDRLAFFGARRLLRLLDRREISSQELTELYIRRIGQHNPRLNAVVTPTFELAVEAAKRADQRRWAGARAPLLGLPITVKDSLETAGVRTTAGAPEYRDHVPERDATVVQRLREAGAVMLGKTNLPLLAGDVQTFNEIFGLTHNPWNLDRTVGGSTGGGAAALAAGLSALEPGSDIGGSIRSPSHFCGVCGLKTSERIVPGRGHLPDAFSMAVIGPLARRMEDLELALGVMAGDEPPADRGWKLRLPPPRALRPRDARIAVWPGGEPVPPSRDVVDAVERAAVALRDAGATVEDALPDWFDLGESHLRYQFALGNVMGAGFPAHTIAEMRQRAARESADYWREVSRRFAAGVAAPFGQVITSERQRLKYRALWDEFFRRYDALIAPVFPRDAFPHDLRPWGSRTLEVDDRRYPFDAATVYAGVAVYAGLPAAAVPVGRSRDGLPVGVQVITAYCDDRTALRVGRWLERELGGYTPPPGYAAPV